MRQDQAGLKRRSKPYCLATKLALKPQSSHLPNEEVSAHIDARLALPSCRRSPSCEEALIANHEAILSICSRLEMQGWELDRQSGTESRPQGWVGPVEAAEQHDDARSLAWDDASGLPTAA